MVQIQKNKEQLLREFFSPDSSRPKYVYGLRPQTFYEVNRRLRKTGANIVAYIDENVSTDAVMGKQVLHSLDSVPSDALVFVADWWFPVTAVNQLIRRNLLWVDIFSYMFFYNWMELDVPHWKGFVEYYDNHIKEFDSVIGSLADEESKDIMRRVVHFRRYHDIEQLLVFHPYPEEQYFEPFLELKPDGESFADVGCFDGQTSIQFIQRCSRYVRIWAFEPNEGQMEEVKKILGNYSRITYCPYGAWNKTESLHFDSNGGDGSKVSESGDTVIEGRRIDDIIDSEVTFIKMDIEGSESNAIEGARETILKYHPRLAISVYHRPCDMVAIPQQVLSIRKDYKIYVRHYTEFVFETVMFFIPE